MASTHFPSPARVTSWEFRVYTPEGAHGGVAGRPRYWHESTIKYDHGFIGTRERRLKATQQERGDYALFQDCLREIENPAFRPAGWTNQRTIIEIDHPNNSENIENLFDHFKGTNLKRSAIVSNKNDLNSQDPMQWVFHLVGSQRSRRALEAPYCKINASDISPQRGVTERVPGSFTFLDANDNPLTLDGRTDWPLEHRVFNGSEPDGSLTRQRIFDDARPELLPDAYQISQSPQSPYKFLFTPLEYTGTENGTKQYQAIAGSTPISSHVLDTGRSRREQERIPGLVSDCGNLLHNGFSWEQETQTRGIARPASASGRKTPRPPSRTDGARTAWR